MWSTLVLFEASTSSPEHQVVLTGLYLRGAPRSFRPPWRSWPAVLHCLRHSAASLEGAEAALRRNGFGLEAATLASPGLLRWAESVCEDERALTPSSPRYPRRWLAALGAAAPAALWVRGRVPERPVLTVLGSRRAPKSAIAFAEGVGAEAARLGLAVASGGAEGCDRAATLGAVRKARSLREEAFLDSAIEVLPCGLGRASARPLGCALTACAPDEPFSTASAMERNAWLYAMGDFAVVAHTHFKTGGTWTGATEALRRRLCRLVVREDLGGLAHRALVALGAVPLRDPRRLEEVLTSEPTQPYLPRIVEGASA